MIKWYIYDDASDTEVGVEIEDNYDQTVSAFTAVGEDVTDQIPEAQWPAIFAELNARAERDFEDGRSDYEQGR